MSSHVLSKIAVQVCVCVLVQQLHLQLSVFLTNDPIHHPLCSHTIPAQRLISPTNWDFCNLKVELKTTSGIKKKLGTQKLEVHTFF